MMLTEYWIFMLAWCFILGKLNAFPVMYRRNLLKTYTWNSKNIDHNYKLNFPANVRFLDLRLLNLHLCKGREPLSEKSKVWLKNRRYAWHYPTEMLFEKLSIIALFLERFIKILWQWCTPGNFLKRIKWTCY